MTDGLLRQRRNLMVVSLILIFLKYGGVRIESVSLLGTQLAFSNLPALYASIWVLFVYYLVRYYQYFRQEPQRPFRDHFWSRFDTLSQRPLEKHALAVIPALKREYSGNFLVSHLERYSLLRCRGQVVVDLTMYAEPKHQYYEVNPIMFFPQAVRAAASAAVNTSAGTDYFLPYALSLAAFWYGFSGPWEGSFCSAFSLPC